MRRGRAEDFLAHRRHTGDLAFGPGRTIQPLDGPRGIPGASAVRPSPATDFAAAPSFRRRGHASVSARSACLLHARPGRVVSHWAGSVRRWPRHVVGRSSPGFLVERPRKDPRARSCRSAYTVSPLLCLWDVISDACGARWPGARLSPARRRPRDPSPGSCSRGARPPGRHATLPSYPAPLGREQSRTSQAPPAKAGLSMAASAGSGRPRSVPGPHLAASPSRTSCAFAHTCPSTRATPC